jgi:SNF2 family DNA or RNA helicase
MKKIEICVLCLKNCIKYKSLSKEPVTKMTTIKNAMATFSWFLGKSGVSYKQHQYDGVEWCVSRELNGKVGGFVADSMGLGKTIMMIGVMISNLLPHTLIVLPNVLIDQWVNEIWRTTGHKPLVFHGPAKRSITLTQLKGAPIVITSYNTIGITKEKGGRSACLLHDIEWSRVLFDEAHHLRNKNRRHFGAKKLMSPIKWLISGTPIQNRVADLQNLCSVLDLIVYKDDVYDTVLENMLCRTKLDAGILLPGLTEECYNIEWGLERGAAERVHKAVYLAENSARRLALITKARQFSTYGQPLEQPLEKQPLEKVVPKEINSEMGLEIKSMVDLEIKSRVDLEIKSRVGLAQPFPKVVFPKVVEVISVLVARNGNGNGKIVFCHFHEEIDILVSELQKHGIKNVATFDGRLPSERRAATLAGGFEILIMQIQTGCEGLNLQTFNEVYFVSPNWNPAMEDQAVARCHRIGQKKEVHVFRFYMCTIEEDLNSYDQKILVLQKKKRELNQPLSTFGKG